ncbi:LRR receptor-like serine/threonine-protein kinase IOS1 [Pyrus communis]|uniref:LRR receptor-like serine/threonine-protein kinase IOS1 n=1 Tax=Pyrus communis TaxID=23211 RepID=UPI0035C02315
MGMLKNLRFVFVCCFSIILLVHAQDDQSGFISLDCGQPSNSSYSESTTGIDYISDATFISTGVSKSVAPAYKATYQLQAAYVRSFPLGVKNCYKVNITKNTKYLIRAAFLYGNYDGLNKPPKFDLVIGASYWDSVAFTDASLITIKEVVHIPTLDYITVCLLNKGTGTPFISSLEFRPLKNTTYLTPTGSLALSLRLDVGSTVNQAYRYPYDALDRFWQPFNLNKWTQLATSLTVDAQSHNDYQVPSIVTRSASTPLDPSDTMDFNWNAPDTSTQYYIFIHFAELQLLKANQSRSFNITLNGDHWFGPFVPAYLSTITVFSPSALTGGNYSFSLVQTENSTLPPILNAMEIYTLIDLSQSETNTDDVSAITNIKSTYGVDKDWQGDPCTPEGYMWEGLNCTFNGSPRIISLDLSSSGLTGEIISYISDLAVLQSLDLSNNSLTGSIPEFLSKMPNLKVLNLERNKFNGSVPADLIERSKSGSLSLSVGENADLCAENSCKKEETKKKKKNIIVPIVTAIGGFFILVVLVVSIFMWLKRGRKQEVVTAVSHQPNNQVDSLESKKRQFTYLDVLQITNNFQTIIGRGGFGKVYHGFVDDTQVAVKMLSPTSGQGYQQFQAEVKLLIRVHHRNLTSLVGYCNEGTNMALIYEFMANGNLDSHLLGENNNANVLTWEGRLQIATDAAQGLEYLHNGCKPPIVHRDVKTTNILLAENFQAKLADFGLSRIFPTDGGTHMSTAVAGTPGYLDPEYHTTGWLNEKSDVYSFGVVLLEIITGRPAISKTQEKVHVNQWVSSMLARGDIKTILDPRLRGDYEINSAWKAVELAMNCVSNTSNKRPNMSEVVRGLKDCLEVELARTNVNRVTESTDSVIYSMNVTTELSPLAR